MQYLTRLKIILQFNKLYLIVLLLSLLLVFLRINFFPYKSRIIPSNSFIGEITNLEYDNDKYKITIKNKEEVIGYYNSKNKLDLKLGYTIKIVGSFYEPTNNTIFNTFNYKEYLNNHYIFYQVKIKSLEVIDNHVSLKYKIKNFIIDRCENYKNAGYIKAFIIGDKTDLDNYETYQNTGVSHLFAISGMHIGLLTSFLYLLFKKSKFQNLIVISFLIIYLNITNYSASLIRSALFFTLLIINKKYNLNIETKNILFLTIIILLNYNPYFIFDYGFLYSILTTYGLILSTKYYRKNYFYNILITSFMAFFFSLPVTIKLNYEFNLLSIINNIFIVPLVSLVVYPLSLTVFILPFLEPILSFMIMVLEKVNYFLNIISINIIIPKVSIVWFIIYYLFLILFIKSNNFKYLIIGILLVFSLKIKPLLNSYTDIYFLDVNQGDSTLLVNKNKSILIDTGGIVDKNISKNTIKLIKSLGLNNIDTLILTHGDYDHMGEAINLVNNFKVDKVIFNCGEFNDLEKELIKELGKKKIKYYSCIKELNVDNNKLYFLQTKKYDNENDNSNVIYTELNGYKFMFMGDAGKEKEKDILEKYNLSHIDVLKVGHHGSRTSSSEEFINEINPKYSIISVGKNNRYGHPNKEVLKTLNNSKIYRTDQNSSIMFKSKNNKLKIETCSP